jgi:hypothetical protein
LYSMEGGQLQIIISLWNIGEVLGVLDAYQSRGLLDETALRQAVTAFLAESEKMLRLGSLQIVKLGGFDK